MSYLKQLIQEGREKGLQEGRLQGQVATIEGLLRAGIPWPAIESATSVDEDALRVLKRRLGESDDGPNETH